MSMYEQELEVAEQASRKAAEVVRTYQSDSNFEVGFKGKNDLITDADLAAEKVILEIIEEAFPDDHFLAEETVQKNELPDGRTWLIDPIDGTTNFAHGFPVFCVSIGLWENGEPQMGVVLEINRDELFSAVTGRGARLNGKTVRVSRLTDHRDSLIATGFPYRELDLVDYYLELFKYLMHHTQGVRRPGAASYDLCCVAAGRFDGFYEYGLNAWDVGAGGLIIREAGGMVTDWEGEDDWLFGERIVAGNPDIHTFLLEAILERFPEEIRKSRKKVG